MPEISESINSILDSPVLLRSNFFVQRKLSELRKKSDHHGSQSDSKRSIEIDHIQVEIPGCDDQVEKSKVILYNDTIEEVSAEDYPSESFLCSSESGHSAECSIFRSPSNAGYIEEQK